MYGGKLLERMHAWEIRPRLGVIEVFAQNEIEYLMDWDDKRGQGTYLAGYRWQLNLTFSHKECECNGHPSLVFIAGSRTCAHAQCVCFFSYFCPKAKFVV